MLLPPPPRPHPAPALCRLATEHTALMRRLLPATAVMDMLHERSAQGANAQGGREAAPSPGEGPAGATAGPAAGLAAAEGEAGGGRGTAEGKAEHAAVPAAAAVAELHKGYLAVVRELLEAAAAGGPAAPASPAQHPGRRGSGLPSPRPAFDPGSFLPDLLALLALAVGDDGPAGDTALAEAVLREGLLPLLRRGSLARLPLLAGLGRVGGPRLLLPLLRRPQSAVRLLGLRLLAACLVEDAATTLGGVAAGGSGADGSDGSTADLVSAAGELAGSYGFPLDPGMWTTLFELLCGGQPWAQIKAALGMATASAPPAATDPAATSAAAAPLAAPPTAPGPLPRIQVPAAAAALLRLAAASGKGREQRGVLTVLCALCADVAGAGPAGSAAFLVQRANRAMLVAQPGWEQQLLQMLVSPTTTTTASSRRAAGSAAVDPDERSNGSGGTGGSGGEEEQQQQHENHAGRRQEQQVRCAALAHRLLVALLAHAMQYDTGGWQHLQTLLCMLRSAPGGTAYTLPCDPGSSSSKSSYGAPSPGMESGMGAGAAAAAGRQACSWEVAQDVAAAVVRSLLAAQAAEAGAAAALAAASAAASITARLRRSTSSEEPSWTMVSQVGLVVGWGLGGNYSDAFWAEGKVRK